MKTVITILAFMAAALALMAIYAGFVKRNGMFFPDVYPEGDWNPPGAKPRDFYFTTPDGKKLHGWLFETAGADAPLMVFFHGNAGNVTNRASVSAELARRGISVFVFDYRGFGRSEGRPSAEAVHIDSLAAYDFARSNFARDPSRIVLYGESIGGPYAAAVASQREACCVVIENSFPSLRRLGNVLFRPLPLGYLASDPLRTAESLNKAGRPVLVIHGKADDVIPFQMGEELHAALRTEKKLVVSDAPGHCQMQFAEPERFFNEVVGFIRQHGAQRR